MRIGIHLPRFTDAGGPASLGRDLARIASAADDAGVDRVSVMDHVWQIGPHGPVEHDMLEAYTTLGFLAAHTSRVKLLTLVPLARDRGADHLDEEADAVFGTTARSWSRKPWRSTACKI